MIRDLKNLYHLFRAVLANFIYGFPAKQMIVVGVTGTDGKTTTSHMIYHILKKEGLKVSLVSTLAANIAAREIDTGYHVTTPKAQSLQRLLRKAKDAGSEYVVLEVTSHAIDQHRIYGIPFTVAVLTNVTHEHLDYHKSYDSYAKTKFKLLERSKTAVVNRDDRSYALLASYRKERSKTQYLTYGMHGNSDEDIQNFPFLKKLPGVYNWYNGLAAVSVGKLLGISDKEMEKHFASFELPEGRLETVYAKKFKIIVDFAHTPHALEELLKTIRQDLKNGRIIHVFGSAGERDKAKRPLMGKTSAEFADVIILTSEDPRGEDITMIAEEIKDGIPQKSRSSVIIVESRKQALLTGIEMAAEDDILVVTGKGHEKSMNFGNGEEPWSDREVVLSLLQEKNML